MPKKRNKIYDLMKAAGIILVILAHLVYNEGMVKQVIHSFHMPLFLLLAGVFAKNIDQIPSFEQYTAKNAKRLLLPYLVTMLMLCIYGGVQAFAKHDIGYFLRHFFSMLSASADGWNSQWGLIYAGPMWFLIALFWIREIFYGIQRVCARMPKYGDECIVGISILLSILSVIVHPYLPSLPFCIIQAFTALAFYAIGWFVHHHPMPWWVYVLCVLVWPFAIKFGSVGIDSCTLRNYPLSFVGACGGTYAVYLLCTGISQLHKYVSTLDIAHLLHMQSPLAWCGMYSLPILCMHDLEMYSDIYNSIMIRLPFDIGRVWGGILAIGLAYLITKLPLLKEVYT